jgi:hypothetical protein
MFDLSGNVSAQKYKYMRLCSNKDAKRAVLYIYNNPKHHKLGIWENYRWSCYNEIIFSWFKKVHLASFGEGCEPPPNMSYQYIQRAKNPD